MNELIKESDYISEDRRYITGRKCPICLDNINIEHITSRHKGIATVLWDNIEIAILCCRCYEICGFLTEVKNKKIEDINLYAISRIINPKTDFIYPDVYRFFYGKTYRVPLSKSKTYRVPLSKNSYRFSHDKAFFLNLHGINILIELELLQTDWEKYLNDNYYECEFFGRFS